MQTRFITTSILSLFAQRLTSLTALSFAAALLGGMSTHAFPIIVSVVETGGDNEATDTVTAKWTGVTFIGGVANEPVPGLAAGASYTVGLFGNHAPAFVDRNHRYTNASDTVAIPSYLSDGEYIMSGNDNRDNAGYLLDITLSASAQVYLLIDNRLADADNTTPPTFDASHMQWVLDEGWVPVQTGLNRGGSTSVPDEVGFDEGADATLNQWFSVYTKSFPGGLMQLRQADNAGQNMYGVVITRTPDSIENPPKIAGVTPANNTLFYDAAKGLSFTAATVSPNTIAPEAIRLRLNDTDVSTALVIGGTPADRTIAYNNLAENTVYQGRIVVSDQNGRSTTNEWRFDTFSSLTSIAVEAEDYNYANGQFVDPPFPGAYAGLAGTPEIDYHDNNAVTFAGQYRTSDLVGLALTGDGTRQYLTDLGVTDYQVDQVWSGDWLNYTRLYPDQLYDVYLRAAGAAPQRVRLDKVTDADLPNQTAFALGTFAVAPGVFNYVPLTDALGNRVRLKLAALTTLRLTALESLNLSLQLNFLLFAPTTPSAYSPYVSEASPGVNAVNVPLNATLKIALANGSTQVTPPVGNAVLRFNGSDVTSTAVIVSSASGLELTYDPPGELTPNTSYPVSVTLNNPGGTPVQFDWSFKTLPYKPIIVSVVETSGDDSVNAPAQFTGQTFTHPNLGPFTLGTFQEDAPAYRNRLHQWNGASATLPLPSYLLGGEYIMSLQENRDNNPFQLDVTLSEPALVYLLVDNRLFDGNNANPPDFSAGNMSWLLANGWVPVQNGLNRAGDLNLPDEVGVDEAGDGVGPGAALNQWSSVYLKRVDESTFTLFQADNAGQNMYGVVVRPVTSGGPRPRLHSPVFDGTTLTISWTGEGRAQQASDLTGPWTDVPGNPPGSFSVNTTEPRLFFRLVSP